MSDNSSKYFEGETFHVFNFALKHYEPGEYLPQKHMPPILQNITSAPFHNNYRTPEVVGPDPSRVYPRQTFANRQISTKSKPNKS